MNGKISNLAQIASLRRYTVNDGRGKGLDVIDIDNGKIRFLLNVTKALDIMQLYHEGMNVSFLSKNAFTAREIPFLKRFEGGMLYTCGLDSAGARPGFEIHGSFHNTNAEILRAECTETEIVVEAVIVDSALFGQNLAVRRKISTAVGSETLTLVDTVTNNGYTPAEYSVLYHINVGYPMLDEGAKIIADVRSTTPTTDFAKEGVDSCLEMTDCVVDIDERCYYHDLAKPEVSLVNEKLGKRFDLVYSQDTLPCFLEWKSMRSGDYALGLEPCTSKVGPALEPKPLGAGESATLSFSISVKNL